MVLGTWLMDSLFRICSDPCILFSVFCFLFSVFCFPAPPFAINRMLFCNFCNSCNFLSLCYFPSQTLPSNYFLMEIDFQAIQTDELKSRIGELRRYL
jgi:hypothetical protein